MATYRVERPVAFDRENEQCVSGRAQNLSGDHPLYYRWFKYTHYVQATNSNPQVGDLFDADGDEILGLTLEDR